MSNVEGGLQRKIGQNNYGLESVKERSVVLIDFSPHGLYCFQSWEQIGLYLRAIDKYKIDLFVEVGVSKGGLQQFIIPRAKFVDGFRYLGCEMDQLGLPVQLWQRNVYTYCGNCFREGFAAVLEGAIQESKRTFLFCDGSNKPKELAYFHKFLRSGDLIAAHDFVDEVSEEDLECLKDEWDELEPELYRKALIPLFRKR